MKLPGITPGPWATDGSHLYAPDGAIIAQFCNPGSKETDYPLVANLQAVVAVPHLLDASLDAIAGFKCLREGLLDNRKALEVIDAHVDELETALRLAGASG